MRRTGVAMLVPLLLGGLMAFSLVGCGEDGKDPVVATLSDSATEDGDDKDDDDSKKSPEDAAMEFSQCMRDNGVPDFPDPEVDDEGRVMMKREAKAGDEIDRETEEKAMEACGEIMADLRGTFSEEDRSKMQDEFLAFAKCMRENGVDMPDPDFSGEGGGAFRMEGAEDPEAFEKAQEACQEFAPGGGPGARTESRG